MSEAVRDMFTNLANNYDLTNDIFSFGMHRSWKTKAIKYAEIKENERVLDIATGTGDLAIEISKSHPKSEVIGLDFSSGMLDVARKRTDNSIEFIEGDALDLPFDDNSINKCFISYGIRNVDSTEKCLKEIYRILKPNGKIVILETGTPTGIVYFFYRLYTRFGLPLLGKFLTKDKASYKYLAETANNYPFGKKFVDIFKNSANFQKVESKRLFFGSSYIYIGTK
ncbi:bifunctional demethylmenaquinone methyltransferase/2-methoxy-6-polyprenyl-1,4-benzoquinol methylase UbiE [Candidatus Kapabacteria bacterium]|nr:bifunctional demethylmenaquinone methyltransferase/2-methoxy-6-polyprenyl-1,4-benzoquinol methylase UbiE [Candidatus Kapabacteria bacterium]